MTNKTIYLLIILFLFEFTKAQISGDIIGTSVISGQTQFVKVNPNTGFTTVVGNQTAAIYGRSMINLCNAAYDCDNNNYVFGANYNGQDLLVTLNKTTGNVVSTFGYNIIGINYNHNNNLYYGLEYQSPQGYKLVSFDPVNGGVNSITSSTISGIPYLDNLDSYALDLNNGKYIFLYATGVSSPPQKIFSIDIATGSVTNYPINYTPNIIHKLMCIVHNNNDGKTYGYARYGTGSLSDSAYICSIALNGVLTKIANVPQQFYIAPNGANNPSSGATLNTVSGVYSYVGMNNRLINVNINTGALISNPILSASGGVSYIQYASCNAVGINEYINTKEANLFYPNPTNDKIIYLNKLLINNGEATLRIYNTIGQVVYYDKINIKYKDEAINLTKLNEGFYIIEYSTKGETYCNSLIIK
jgi:hypothetical protein